MIEINIQQQNIQINNFRLIHISGVSIITTENRAVPLPYNHGICVYPLTTITDIPSGNLFITQICLNHTLKIKGTNNLLLVDFNSAGEILRDTTNEQKFHYHQYLIRNNQLDDLQNSNNKNLIFYDTPFTKLSQNWSGIEYYIQFETWFQYNLSSRSNDETAIKPILSFQWWLKYSATNQAGDWLINNSSCSDPSEIVNSIKQFGETDEPLLPKEKEYRRLNTVMETVYPF